MRLPSLAAILPLLSPRQTIPDYQSYPPCTQSCFETGVANSNCQETTEVVWVACLCSDDTILASFAQCVFASCGAQILNTTAVAVVYNCQINGSPSSLTVDQLVADGETSGTDVSSASKSQASSASTPFTIPGSTSTMKGTTSLTSTSLTSISATTTTSSPNTDPTSTKASTVTPTSSGGSSSSGGGSSGLNTASLIGTIVGSITGAIASCLLVWFGWKKHKRDKRKERNETTKSRG